MRRISLFPPDLALVLRPRRLRALARRFHGPASLDVSRPAHALFGRPFDARFVDALDDLARIASSPIAHEAILEAARVCGVDARGWDALPVASLVARLLCDAARGDEPSRRVLARARIRIGRLLAASAVYELFTRSAIDVDAIVRAAGVVHKDALVDAWGVVGEDGRTRAAVLHLGLAERDATLRDGAPRARTRRSIFADVLELDPHVAPARVALSLARPSQLADWTAALELDDRPSFTLKPLHERGSAWLASLKPTREVRRIEVVACEVDDGDRIAMRSDDALAAMHRRIDAAGGYMWRATLRCELAGERAPVDVTIELPNRLLVSDPRFAQPIREALRAIGLASPGAAQDDVAALGSVAHGAWRFEEVVGTGAFAKARRRKTVVEVASRRPGDERFRRWGSMLVAHEVQGEDARYAVADTMSIRAHDVPAALTRWKVDAARLGRVLRRKMGLAPVTLQGELPEGVVPIGTLRAKKTRVVFLLLLRIVRESEAKGIAERVRRACGSARPVLLVGAGRKLGVMDEVELTPAEQIGAADVRRVVVTAAELLGIASELEPHRFATGKTPLVLMAETREAYLRRARLEVTTNQIDMLFALAEAEPASMPPGVLGTKISANATLPDQVVRKAMADLGARVRASCEKAGVAVKEAWVERLVRNERGKGYRLGVGFVLR